MNTGSKHPPANNEQISGQNNEPDFRIVIPARYASERLPGKPLRLIHGKTMIEWVYRAAQQADASEIVVATDDQRICDEVEAFGGHACMTSNSHRSGTDRILEVTRTLGWSDDSIVVNLQGDEPLMPAVNLVQVAANLVTSGCDMATLHKDIDAEHARDPNQVKLVFKNFPLRNHKFAKPAATAALVPPVRLTAPALSPGLRCLRPCSQPPPAAVAHGFQHRDPAKCKTTLPAPIRSNAPHGTHKYALIPGASGRRRAAND